MAKRKRKAGSSSKLNPVTNYRDEQYVLYIHSAETGILEAWTIDPDIRDGDVREVLRGLMRDMKRSGQLPAPLTTAEPLTSPAGDIEEVTSQGNLLLRTLILGRLRLRFQSHGALDTEAVIGILSVINSSVGTWNRGMRGQEYLKFIQDFLGLTGVNIRQLTDEEVEMLGLSMDDYDDDYDEDDESIEGEYHEIK
jgi:hypothetical protein